MTDDVKIKVIERTDPRLGRIVQHDPRSRAYAFTAPAKLELVSKRHLRFIPVLDQGNLGSCTGNAGIGAIGTSPAFATIVPSVVSHDYLDENAAVKLYSDATAIDEWSGSYPPDDTGSSGLAVAKVLKSRGWISGYQHTFSFEDMQAALQLGPVLLGINWYENFFDPDSKGNLSISTSRVAGGHEIAVDEIDMENQRFGFTNSWGESWGIGGRAYIPFDLMKRLLSEDGDVVVLVPLNLPAPVPTPSPDPVVGEVVDEDSQVLWDTVKDWANARHYTTNKRAAKAVKEWAVKKGLTS
jgi:hypothetical protein